MHRHTIGALSDVGYCLHRSAGGGASVVIRRMVLERRIRRFNDAGHLRQRARRTPRPQPARHAEPAPPRRGRETVGGVDHAQVTGIRLRWHLDQEQSLAAHPDLDGPRADRGGSRRRLHRRGAVRPSPGCAARVRDLRKEERPNAYAVSIQRYGEVLACQRDPEAISVLDDALDIRESQIGEDHTNWSVQDCAKSLWWAYDRLGRDVEAEAVARRYRLTGGPEDWVPAFVLICRDTHGGPAKQALGLADATSQRTVGVGESPACCARPRTAAVRRAARQEILASAAPARRARPPAPGWWR